MKLTNVAALSIGVGVVFTACWTFAAGVTEEITEVIVTAQKREQNIQDVGIAMQAFSADKLAQLGVQDSTSISEFTPGVSVSAASGGQHQDISIRGVTQNDYNDIVEAPNAIYLDDGYIPFTAGQAFALLDIDRIEIQKGPQGTLFGRNATGGLLQYVSKKPNFDGVSGYLDIENGVSDSPNNPMRFVAEAAVGGPVTDTFAVRVAAKWDQQNPYLINRYPTGAIGPLNGNGADLGGARKFAGRASFLFKPTENFSSLLMINGADTHFGTSPFEQAQVIAVLNDKGQQIDSVYVGPNETRNSIAADGSDGGWDINNSGSLSPGPGRPVPGGDFFGYKPTQKWITSNTYAYDNYDPGFIRTYGYDLKNVWNINDSVTLTSVSDYKKFDKAMFTNASAGPFAQIFPVIATDSWAASQEVRLNGTNGRLNWQTGLYYLYIDHNSTGALGVFPAGISVASLTYQRTRSSSAFGQFDWNFADQWTIVAGARITKELKEDRYQQAIFAMTDPLKLTDGQPIALIGPNPDGSAFHGSADDTLWAGKLQLEYRPKDGMMIYAGANRGVKASGFNAQLPGGRPIPVSYTPYKGEVLWNYEMGLKSSWLDKKLQFNTSVFYYDYKDYQAFLFDGVGGLVVNRDAKTYGAEATIDVRPMKGLNVSAGVSYTHARVYDMPLEIGYDTIRTVQPSYTPPVQANVIVRYSHDFMSGTLSEMASASYSDHYYFTLRNFTADASPSRTKVNVGVDWQDPSSHLNIGFGVDNLTDQRLITSIFDLALVCGCSDVSYQLPRTYNLKMRYSY